MLRSHCPNESVFSNRLNWPYDSPHSLRLGSSLFQTCGPARRQSLVSKPAARPTDDECSSVDRMQLSNTGIGDELAVVGQVTRGVAGQGPVDESRNLEQTHCYTESQCSWQSTGKIWSHRLVPVTRLVAVFWTDCTVRRWCHSTAHYSSPGDW